MFFNSLNRKLKKIYRSLNPQLKDYVFPRGEKEFVYVGNMLDIKFSGKDLVRLIQIYASVYTYYGSTLGNAYDTFRFAKKKTTGVLTDDQTLTLIGIVSVSTVASKVRIEDPVAAVDEYKGYAKNYINTVNAIANHPDVFATKKIGVGSRDNPILVAGVQGVREYIESLDCSVYTFGLASVKYSKTSTVYLTHKATGISYAIDEYTLELDNGAIKLGADVAEIQKLWFNIYGTENCPISPATLHFKAGSQMAICEQQYLEAEATDEKEQKDNQKENVRDSYLVSEEKELAGDDDKIGNYGIIMSQLPDNFVENARQMMKQQITKAINEHSLARKTDLMKLVLGHVSREFDAAKGSKTDLVVCAYYQIAFDEMMAYCGDANDLLLHYSAFKATGFIERNIHKYLQMIVRIQLLLDNAIAASKNCDGYKGDSKILQEKVFRELNAYMDDKTDWNKI